jgi:hypothetical protein
MSKILQIVFKNPVRTSKKTQHVTITKINWLMLFKEIIAVIMRNIRIPQIHYVKMQLFIIKTGGTYCDHGALKS